MVLEKICAGVAVATLAARYSPYHLIGPYTTFFTVIAVATFANFFYTLYLWPYVLSPLRHLPMPEGGHWMFGHGPEEVKKSSPVFLWDMNDKFPVKDFYRYLSFFGEEKLVPVSARANRELTTNPSIDWPDMAKDALRNAVGDGLMFAEPVRHKDLKKYLGKCFTASQQRILVPAFWKIASKWSDKLKGIVLASDSQDAEINMLDWTNAVTLDMIGKTAWGRDWGCLDDLNAPIYQLYERFYPQDGADGFDAICNLVLPLFFPMSILKHLPFRVIQDFQQTKEKIMQIYKDTISESKAGNVELAVDGNYKDLLSVLLNTPEISPEDLLENMHLFTAAGFGTNAALLVWLLYTLGTQDEIQTKLRAEIRSTLGSPGAELDYEIMDSMKYLDHFVMEVLRLFPSGPATFREAKRDIVVAGTAIPKGTAFTIGTLATNRSKALWGEDAEECNPDRWEGLKAGVQHDGHFMTFLLGPHACIGKEYALRAIKTNVIALVSELEFRYDGPDPMKNLVPGMTLRPKGGLDIQVRLAEPW